LIGQSGSGEPVFLTDGLHSYRAIRPWARMPQGQEIGALSQLIVNDDGYVIACQRSSPAILIFAPDGSLHRAWDHPKLSSVHGIFLCADQTFFVTSFDRHQVLRFDIDGHLLQELGTFDRPTWGAPFNHPTDIGVSSNGDIFVTDGYGNARVHRFDPDGRLLLSWGQPGTGPSEFSCPHGVWINAQDRVIVLDRDNNRIQVFDTEGVLASIWSGFVKPMDIWGNASGEFFVSDQTPRISRVDKSGTIIGAMRGFTAYPHGLWGDRHGNLFIAEQLPAGIAKYELVTETSDSRDAPAPKGN